MPETVTAIYVPAGVKEKMEKLAEEDENYAYYWPEEKLALGRLFILKKLFLNQ